ncbi:MAG: hypothetical protein QW666_01165 [Candidatus Woesearchaeota archaeon]
MLKDCDYNKVRILHDLSRLVWHIKRFAKNDAKKGKHDECHKLISSLEKDLEKYVDKLAHYVGKSLSK